jgi:hypothetical protein
MGEGMLKLFNKRNMFDLSHERKLSCSMGKLVPIMVEEIVPGDTFKVNTEMLIRIAPMLAPVMHQINVFTHFFFVPFRLIWQNWETFITGGADGNQAPAPPTIYFSPSGVGTLADHMGMPTDTVANVIMSALPFRAYAMIYNEWYRDNNLQQKVPVSLADGDDITTHHLTLLTRNWEKDYFTSALPWPQRGNAVSVGVQGTAPLYLRDASSANVPLVGVSTDADTANIIADGGNTPAGPYPTFADLSTAAPISINILRQAFQIQKWMERSARGGARYVESLLAHFGVRSSDARLQRPEYLGGGKSPVVISEVLQTAYEPDSPLATMAGHGFSHHASHSFKKSFEEHGLVLGIMSILPRTAYQQGLPRMFSRKTRYDYYWPEFSHLGEQAVLGKELYMDGDFTTGESVADNTPFGYQGRYDEYRRRESSVHGEFRTTLDFWHMGRKFTSRPLLNEAFIQADPTKRINAVTTGDNCWIQLKNQVSALRPIPKVGEPGLIDHN